MDSRNKIVKLIILFINIRIGLDIKCEIKQHFINIMSGVSFQKLRSSKFISICQQFLPEYSVFRIRFVYVNALLLLLVGDDFLSSYQNSCYPTISIIFYRYPTTNCYANCYARLLVLQSCNWNYICRNLIRSVLKTL